MRWSQSVIETPGLVSLVDCESLKWITRFERLMLTPEQHYSESPKDQELGAIVLLGTVTFEVNGKQFKNVGYRKSLWDGRPSVLYIPPGTSWSVEATSKAEIILCGADGSVDPSSQPFLRRGETVQDKIVGRDNWKRIVRFLLGSESETQHLFLGECINPPGNWSGTPPHRHMGIQNGESLHEEAYYFRCSDPQGWGIERTWWPEQNIDVMKLIKDYTATVIPLGYHQVVAAPGYWLDYIFCMAGPVAEPSPVVEPEHEWISKETIPKVGFENLYNQIYSKIEE